MSLKMLNEAELVRVFIGESDKINGQPLYEAIVQEARRRELAGATVLRGIMGYGANSRVHTAKILQLSEDLPLVIEIVDEPERIASFVEYLNSVIGEGLVTLEKVRVILYRHSQPGD
jgi:uncharacterized protein